MQVTILEYVVPRVLEYSCVKFDRFSTSKILLIDILPSGSILTEHIWPIAGPSRTYPVLGPDISDLPGPFTPLIVDFLWVPHRGFTPCFFSSHALY
jgi:hypothetical protein